MSEDGIVQIEDADDAPEQPAPVAETPAEPEAPAETPAEEAPAEVEAVEVAGKKYVPVGAVIAERKQRQEAEKQAARVSELEAYVAQNQPYIEFLKANKDFLKPRQEPVQTPQHTEPDPDVVAYARGLQLYKPDGSGQLDLDTASQLLSIAEKRARSKAEEATAPLVQESINARATTNYNYLLQLKTADGQPIRKETVDALWRATVAEPGGLKTLADPEGIKGVALMALGMDALTRKSQPSVTPPAKEPVITESVVGPKTPTAMSQLEERIAKDRGLTQTKWLEQTKGYKPGRTNVLEDD